MKQLKLTEEYCEKVGLAIGKSSDETKILVESWWDKGKSISQIKGMLINLATDNGKSLIFVSKKGLN